jgi:hypothetical protein
MYCLSVHSFFVVSFTSMYTTLKIISSKFLGVSLTWTFYLHVGAIFYETAHYVSVSAGVPQGSVLGSLLFLVYINDIGDKLLSLSRLFADDTSLGYANQDEDQIKYVINHDLHELGDWSKRWLMSFNPNKTEIMLFENVENSTNFNFYFDGKLIPLTLNHKHLGINLARKQNGINM